MPKRLLYHGDPSPFDWEGEAIKIRDAEERQLERSTSGASDFTVSAPSPSPDVTPKSDVKKEGGKDNKFDPS